MAEMNPTVVITHLDDDKLRKSIDSLVNYVDEKFKAMTQSTTNAVNTMQQSLNKLGEMKITSTGGGESRSAAIKKEKKEVEDLKVSYDQMAQALQKATRYPSEMRMQDQAKSARESYHAFMQGYKAQGEAIARQIQEAEAALNRAVQNRVTDLNAKLDNAKKKLGELYTTLYQEQEKARSAGTLGMPFNAGIARTQQSIEYTKKHIEELNAAIAKVSPNMFTEQVQQIEQLRARREQVLNTMKEETREQKKQEATIQQTTTAAQQQETTEEQRIAKIKEEWELEQKLHQEQGKRYDAQNEINRQLELENAKTAENLAFQERINAARAAKEGGGSKRVRETNELTGAIAGLLGIQEKEVAVTDVESASQHRLANYLNQLKNAYQRLDKEGMNASHGKMLADEIQRVSRAYAEMTKQMNRPTSLKNALGLDESTLDKIAYKIQQLNAYRAGLNITKQAGEMRSVETAIDRLKKKQDELMGKNQQLIKSNNALTRSWNYMKNRLAFYFTVGASTQLVKNLIEVRSQYEMNERALGILIDSAERGTQIFNELSQMALVSPYTLIELSTAAKQLSAYDVAAKDLVDTTRRLADISAAVGLPVERLTTALGQIKAFEHLTSMTARRFSSAGIPLIKALADHFTELEGRMVSVADVYDRMKKKAISYNDVMAVITEMTDEGGKFFDFQAKMADTLKVQLANLTLAWNNMLNDIGKSEQGVIVGGIKGLKELFLQWKNIDKFIRNIAWTFGIAKFIQIVLIARRNTDLFTSSLTWNMIVGKKLTTVLSTLGGALGKIITSPLTWWALLATSVVSAGMALYDANKALKEFNKSIAEGGKENFENTKKFLEQYKEVRNSLYKNEEYSFVDPGGIKRTRVRTVAQDIDKKEAEKTWVAIREQIELTSQSSDYFIGKLLSIEDVNKRVEKGFDYLQKIQDVYGAMSSMDDDTIAIKETYNAWWNLGLAQDGVIGNLKEYIEAKKHAEEEEAKGAAWHETETVFAKRIESLWSSADIALQQYRADLDVTLESMANFAQTQGFDFDQEREFFAQTINKIVTTRNLGEREALQFRLDAEERYREARIKQFDEVIEFETKRAGEAAAGAEKDRLLLRVQAAKQEKAAWLANQEEMYGEGRALFEGFTKYMTRNHGSELQKLFGNMTKKEIEQINWSEPRWKQWAEDNAKAFAEQFGVSFDKLKDYVNDANQMTIFIKTIIQKPDDKSVYDTLTEADKAADEAWSKIQRLNTRKNELLNKGASAVGTSDIDREYANTLQEITEAQDDYNKALAKGGHSKKEDRANTKNQKQAETELQKVIKEEVSLINKARSAYKNLTKEGVDSTRALTIATSGYEKSIRKINDILAKNGLRQLDLSKYVGIENPRPILDFLNSQLSSGRLNRQETETIEGVIRDLNIDVVSFDQKTLISSLNNELSKIKDEYELAVELDANPELGGAFADLFGINTDELPQTFGEAFDRANKVAKEKLSELNIDVKDFDLLSTNLKGDDKGLWNGIDVNSDFLKDLIKWQKDFREIFKKNLTETEKTLDDFVKKYGDYSDKVAEIEADKIEKIKRLNDAYYNDEMRNSDEYRAKLRAINEGARKETQQAEFDMFKNSRFYTQMFENLDHVSTITIRAMRNKLRGLIDTMNDLTPEQLKQVMQQYEKLEQKLIKRNPFKGLVKNLKDYIKQTKERRNANEEWARLDEEYTIQEKILGEIKKQLKEKRASKQPNKEEIENLAMQLNIQQAIVDKLKEALDLVEKQAQKYNLLKKVLSDQAIELSKVIGSNLSSLASFRDFIVNDLGWSINEEFDAWVDGMSKVSDGINQITSSAQGGDIVGTLTGVGKTVHGIVDGFNSLFGGGSAKNKKISKEIARSERDVRNLESAYKDLEQAIEEAYGMATIGAQRAALANKELQLVELQRQLRLEESRRSKDKDNRRIEDLREQIKDLQREIKRTSDAITNDLLGISSIGSFAEELVSSMISAFKNGEDYMLTFEESFDKMIDNIIMKSIVSRVVAQYLDAAWADIDKLIKARTESIAEEQAKFEKQRPKDREEMVKAMRKAYEPSQDEIDAMRKDWERNMSGKGYISSTRTDDYFKALIKSQKKFTEQEIESYANGLTERSKQLEAELKKASVMSDGDIHWIMSEFEDAKDSIFAPLVDELKKWYTFGKSASEDKLSALQQGIQGITEDTAGALEGYMNGVSQQVYLQSDLLTQIRDAVVMIDSDTQMGVQAQMLLQLQQTYAVQMAIQNILQGWSNPSGMAMRVEMVN